MKEKLVPAINTNDYDGRKVIVLTIIIPWSDNNAKRAEMLKRYIDNSSYVDSTHITLPGL